MANLKEVKTRIQSVTSTQQITKAMKMVAAAKLRRAQDRMMQMRPFSEKLKKVMQNVSASIDIAQVEIDGFLAKHVLARRRRPFDQLAMRVGRRADHNSLGTRAGKKLLC